MVHAQPQQVEPLDQVMLKCAHQGYCSTAHNLSMYQIPVILPKVQVAVAAKHAPYTCGFAWSDTTCCMMYTECAQIAAFPHGNSHVTTKQCCKCVQAKKQQPKTPCACLCMCVYSVHAHACAHVYCVCVCVCVCGVRVVWCGVVWCGVVWCGVVWCGVVWCVCVCVVWCGVCVCVCVCTSVKQSCGFFLLVNLQGRSQGCHHGYAALLSLPWAAFCGQAL